VNLHSKIFKLFTKLMYCLPKMVLMYYDCQYNPIELAWAHCKSHYNKHIGQDSDDRNRVANLWMEALDNFSTVMWANSVRHCDNLISEDWRREMGTYSLENIPPIIITLESLSLSSDSSDDKNGSPSLKR
jgi:hypothetical protein